MKIGKTSQSLFGNQLNMKDDAFSRRLFFFTLLYFLTCAIILDRENIRKGAFFMSKSKNVSIFISLLLRHKPEEVGLNMDKHGWVNVNDLIRGINNTGKYHIDMNELEEIVATDNKGRYVFNENKTKIKACQGHSIPWIEVELVYGEPPEFLYHGTTTKALSQIEHSGVLSKMKRHAVQLQSTMAKSWQSAERWGLTPVIVEINAKKMFEDGYKFGRSENDVWCVDEVPTKYFTRRIYTKE